MKKIKIIKNSFDNITFGKKVPSKLRTKRRHDLDTTLGDNYLPMISKNIKIGDCMNCIHRIEFSDMCGLTPRITNSGFNSYASLNMNDDDVFTPPITGCPQQEQTYIFNFVK